MKVRVLYGLLSCGVVCFGQIPPAHPSFEVASLKRASTPAGKDDYSAGYNAGVRAALAGQGLRISGQSVRVTDNSLRDLIRLAYQVKDYQIVGPAWMADDKFEIAATMPAGGNRNQAPAMLRRLLEERFHLQLKGETRNMTVFALVNDGAKLVPSTVARGGPGLVNVNTGRVRAFACPLSGLAELLTKAFGRPVIDATEIAGLYDFDLSYLPEYGAAEADERPALATALRQQYRLRIEKRAMPVEVLVVERADRLFAEN
jgi:uncharacterized protein (TIGR03435 family)